MVKPIFIEPVWSQVSMVAKASHSCLCYVSVAVTLLSAGRLLEEREWITPRIIHTDLARFRVSEIPREMRSAIELAALLQVAFTRCEEHPLDRSACSTCRSHFDAHQASIIRYDVSS